MIPAETLATRLEWALVMERENWQCGCRDAHPDHRGGRCLSYMPRPGQAWVENARPKQVKLIAAPKDPTRQPRKGEILYAWCPDCYKRTAAALQRIAREYRRQQLADAQESLFPLEES